MSRTMKTTTICLDESLLCLLQMKLGMFLQPYEGLWVSCTMKTMTICFDEMLLWLLQIKLGMSLQPYEGGGCHTQ